MNNILAIRVLCLGSDRKIRKSASPREDTPKMFHSLSPILQTLFTTFDGFIFVFKSMDEFYFWTFIKFFSSIWNSALCRSKILALIASFSLAPLLVEILGG